MQLVDRAGESAFGIVGATHKLVLLPLLYNQFAATPRANALLNVAPYAGRRLTRIFSMLTLILTTLRIEREQMLRYLRQGRRGDYLLAALYFATHPVEPRYDLCLVETHLLAEAPPVFLAAFFGYECALHAAIGAEFARLYDIVGLDVEPPRLGEYDHRDEILFGDIGQDFAHHAHVSLVLQQRVIDGARLLREMLLPILRVLVAHDSTGQTLCLDHEDAVGRDEEMVDLRRLFVGRGEQQVVEHDILALLEAREFFGHDAFPLAPFP